MQNRDDRNLNVPYLYVNGDKVVLNWNWLDNDWNDNKPAVRFATRFISPPVLLRGVLFRQLAVPTAEHLADLI